MNTSKLLRVGSSKDVYESGTAGELTFGFSDRLSVFDLGALPVEFKGLGQLRCAIAGRLFQVLEKTSVPTHYLSHDVDAGTMLVQAAYIPELDSRPRGAESRMVPLEVLFRYIATSEFVGRVERGEVDRQKVERCMQNGDTEVRTGMRFKPPFVECSTKWQDANDYISDAVAADIARLSLKNVLAVQEKCANAATILRRFFRSFGVDLCDGKFEVILPFAIADSISPDELRLIGEDGLHYDKEPVRRWYETEQPEWYERLQAAKKQFPTNKSEWPTYEALPPQWVIDKQLHRYAELAELIKAV